MATILDVSKEAQVSAATVSRVVNGKGRVNPAVAKRVLDAVERLQYVPNVSARNLRRNESRIVLILAPNVTNPYYTHIIAGIGKAAHQIGYSSFLCNTEGDQAQEEQLLNMLTRRQADGAILLATEQQSKWLTPYAERFALVQCSEYDPNLNIARVSIDNYAAAIDAMAYLLKLNHTRIGIISSVNKYVSTALRMKGYRDALAAADIVPKEDYIRYATIDYSFKSGFDAARSLLSQEKRPTALFCISDMLALGAIASAREMGFRVPEDVTVIGFDDVEQTTMFHPHVTTMAQPCFELGEKAMEMLESQLMHSSSPREATLPHKLMVRESSSPRRSTLDFSAAAFGR
jgi:DNA-binding LacI/PurR family transcriptional regulator